MATTVIMGKAGTGKTSLYNKLCETEHAAAYSSKSLTRQLFRSEVVQGRNRFTLIDTPGTDSQDEVFKHSFLLKEALTCDPVNAISVLVQYNDRCASALEEFDKSIAYLKEEYRRLVIVIVTKFDMAPGKHKEEIRRDYRQAFEEEGYPRIIFSSWDTTAKEMATEMLNFMTIMPPQKLQYEEAEFLKYFRISDESRARKKVSNELQQQVTDILAGYKQMITDLGCAKEKDDIITAAIAFSRYDLDQIYDTFCKEHGEAMIDCEDYVQAITLQKAIENGHRDFREAVKEYMSYNPDDPTDWKNCIRKCQHCGEVWVKVSGCNDGTTCGNRDSSLDRRGKPWSQFEFVRDASTRRITYRRSKESTVTETSSSLSSKASNNVKVRGCGKYIVWKDQPRLSDDELKKCFEVKDIDNIIRSMQQQPDFEEAMQRKRRKIDTSFTR